MGMSGADLEQLYALYGFAVRRRCERLLGSRTEADDALHEVFVRVHRYGASFRGEAPLPWLYRIADRYCFEVLQRRRRAATPEEADRTLREREDGLAGPESPERVRLVAQVLAACREPVREVAVLYYVDEMTQDEVAAAARCSRKTVKERLARFLETARGLLAPQEDQS